MEKIYKIRIILPTGRQISFTVDNYEILDNGMISFYDNFSKTNKIFDARICQIEVIDND